MLILSAVVLAIPYANSTWLVLALISVSMTGSAVANALNASLLLDLLDSTDDAGKATGLLVTGGNVFGLLAPIDRLGSSLRPQPLGRVGALSR
jgi:hypothetical protein